MFIYVHSPNFYCLYLSTVTVELPFSNKPNHPILMFKFRVITSLQ